MTDKKPRECPACGPYFIGICPHREVIETKDALAEDPGFQPNGALGEANIEFLRSVCLETKDVGEFDAVRVLNNYSYTNLQRKLCEANARIVEFEDIKKGHLQVLEQSAARIASLEQEIQRLTSEVKRLSDT